MKTEHAMVQNSFKAEFDCFLLNFIEMMFKSCSHVTTVESLICILLRLYAADSLFFQREGMKKWTQKHSKARHTVIR